MDTIARGITRAADGTQPPATLWRPLRTPIFRNLLIADVVSDAGTFIQGVGAAWLMVSLGAGPVYVALIQTAATLPFFLFALPAGAVGDIIDRRKLILVTETWMVCAAIALAAATLTGVITPLILLVLTFALAAGDAIEAPSWRAVLPESVPKEDLPAVAALNGVEFNIARAVGPAVAGVLIATAGVGATFMVNVLSFGGVILAVARWKRPVQRRTAPRETFRGATVAAIRYVRFAPALRALVLRSGVVMFFASASFALLPTLAHGIGHNAMGYGFLLGSFGVGAIGGALLLQPVRARWSTEAVASSAVAVLGAAIVATGLMRTLAGLIVVMLASGAAWIVFFSIGNVLAQTLAPDWVRARVLAIFMLLTQGGLAAGSALWGIVAARAGVETTLLWAGVGTIATIALGLVARLPRSTGDMSSWNHWPMPVIAREAAPRPQHGPVLVTLEYSIAPHNAKDFLRAIRRYGRVRRRDGARSWGIFRDIERADVYVESFLVSSWAEHLRQHERATRADRHLAIALHRYACGKPRVRHLIHVQAER